MRHQCLRVVIADQHALLTECLGIVFEMRHYEYGVVPIPEGSAHVDRLLGELRGLRPDVLLVNADLGPTCSGTSLIRPMVEDGVAVVVLTEATDEARWGECLALGARTVLPKSVSLATMVATVRKVGHGEAVLDRAERARLIETYRRRGSGVTEIRHRLDLLTAREAEVLRHLMAGHAVTEIARARVVSTATVRTQVKSVLMKLEVSSQLAAVAAARTAGWQSWSSTAAG